ncbi:MAG: amidohydrolase [Deltaproteobacteria bacterium]|nr:MAG: amidohydrolase [Deltaproteobacteria bacterium]
MIIDCHTHIFPEKIKNNREKYFNGEDQFSLLYKNPKSKIATAEELIESMNKNYIDKSIVFGFPWNNKKNAVENNDYIIEKVKIFKERLIPFACFNPCSDYSLNEAERCIKNGFKGFGELSFYKSDFDTKTTKILEPFMDMAYKFNLPVMLHTNEPTGHNYNGKAPITIGNLGNLLNHFNKNKIILSHLGGGLLFYLLLKKPPEMKNILFDTAAIPFIYKKNIYKILQEMGLEEKIILGTDFPLISPERYFNEINENKLSDKFLKKIYSENILLFTGL